ncbi:hypothetical protein [Flavilitoribacter nigricans]|uniref:VCBS repeat-containing protein n=1 Tax=Flavilitoribacter nigricans (strain ATCC 23147 / DSM 23189 / NBRC 102662 / NCIMB 1420 / SS-2) TaxID=1122177 RepID=A0A2D0N154_FLAN2|nr:hypothetical protein [Flavilitoribacter nigricans]PHN02160.1 hypothetical protein CRP01_33770 [Flavilitoribacter nigricans DSM 23189 = NBRC 102662]
MNTEFKEVTVFKLTDTLIADFNGDGNSDRAILKKIGETSGLLIQHGETMEEIRIGFGQSFAIWTDFNLNWIDLWALVNDSGTYEIVIENNEITGTRKIELENPSIAVRKEEEGGGLITFKDGKYQWIHQAE